ncbi:unnamed protein product, partial [Arabidopsis halleri]
MSQSVWMGKWSNFNFLEISSLQEHDFLYSFSCHCCSVNPNYVGTVSFYFLFARCNLQILYVFHIICELKVI